MRRLHLEIYRAVLGVLLLFAALVALVFWVLDGPRDPGRRLAELTRFVEATIPAADAEPARLEAWARAVADPFDLDLSLFDASGRLVVAVGEPIALPAEPQARPSSLRGGPGHRAVVLDLADGRTLVARGDPLHRPFVHFLSALFLLALATALAAHPIARRLTRRLELLRKQVEALGTGRLSARVPVEGSDEVAELARAFNSAAERIERLVADKSRLLGETSHELRSPLARVRAALGLLGEGSRPELAARADRDLEELDQLIGELLVASRLDAPETRFVREAVDLLALAAEEAARLDAAMGERGPRIEIGLDARAGTKAEGKEVNPDEPTIVLGDPRLLRRGVRNLLENALRHGSPPVRVGVAASPRPGFVRLVVEDRGAGVPPSERERIFEPFYRPPGQSNATGGVGLGLALVRQIATRHGGQVAYEGHAAGPPLGARLVLDLPAAPARLETPNPSA